jgi:hypothetical protein
MIGILLLVCGLLAIAVLSATAAYRLSGSAAWTREYGLDGFGLTIELSFLFLTFLAAASISLIMANSFKSLFLLGGWRSPAYLIAAVVMAAGVSIYMVIVAPQTLAKKQNVVPDAVARECRLPYLLYAPFSIISWAGFVLPVLALVVVSIGSDYDLMSATKAKLAADGTTIVALSDSKPDTAKDRVGIYGLAYREAVDSVQRMVSRYLWVVGVFMIFIIVILNTRITAVFTEESQDAFKWLMWALLAVALGICLFGLARYQSMRYLAIAATAQLQAVAGARGQLPAVAAAKSALLELQSQGPVEFWRTTFQGGSFMPMLFGYALQIVLAKATHRPLLQMIFPRRVATFLEAFMLSAEEKKS